MDYQESTGIEALDEVLCGLEPGDNVVWRLDTIELYRPFAEAIKNYAVKSGKKFVYFRFANYEPVIETSEHITIYSTKREAGFESFISDVHSKIAEMGEGAFYVFDSLSDLAENYFSDRMIGNFFKLTCPYLRKLKTIAYFALYRQSHSYHAIEPIMQTTQLLIDVYSYNEKIYIQPSRVVGRHTPTLYMLHLWDKDRFVPVKQSAYISRIINSTKWNGLPSASYRMVGIWDKLFMQAENLLDGIKKGVVEPSVGDEFLNKLFRLILSRDEAVLKLCRKYLSLQDVIFIWKRTIGTGMIGGKSLGVLLSHSILAKHSERWRAILEAHDSFFIGSDVYYTYLVENGCWWKRQEQKNPQTFLKGTDEIRLQLLNGKFPDYIVQRFSDMLDYYGQSPIIIRSSSLLEDNFGNAFAGKYESIFCANQGTKEERLKKFLDAVRIIYASTMSEEALSYRKKRGVLEQDEQMALLVQRVSGMPHGNYFFPHLAGVAFSFNPYVWNKEIDPEAGVIRLVFGLGTRAVDRSDDDYTRLIALNVPEKRPEGNLDAVKRYAQRRVDAINLSRDTFENVHFVDLLKETDDIPLRLIASKDYELEKLARERQQSVGDVWILTFDPVIRKTDFIKDMREALAILKEAYGSHVDVEFTANFLPDGSYSIDIVQCRPLQVRTFNDAPVEPLPVLPADQIIMLANSGIIGHSRSIKLDRIIYVRPEKYGKLSEKERYTVARIIGELTHIEEEKHPAILLIGPGRWGTSTPSLGIPVKFSEIHMATALCEIDLMHEGLVPDLSLGTHFLNEMVEMNMLYIAFFCGQKHNVFNEHILLSAPNKLPTLLPSAVEWSGIIYVIDGVEDAGEKNIFLNANALGQKALIYWKK